MAESRDEAKRAKKAAKSLVKAEKKLAKRNAAVAGQQSASGESTPPRTAPTPAERSAQAAERSVSINQRRFLVQVAVAVLTLIMVLIAWFSRGPSSEPTPSDGSAVSQPSPEGAHTVGDD